VYPALAVLRALQDKQHIERDAGNVHSNLLPQKQQLDVLWIGGEGGIEEDLLDKEKVPFTTIPAAGLHGVGLRALPGNLWKILQGFFSAKRILEEFHPQVIFYTGGYLAVPVASASRLPWLRRKGLKNVVFVPDIEPGLALRFAARLSDKILLTVEESMEYFDNQSELLVTGYPTRLRFGVNHIEEELEKFNLDGDMRTLLVFGGSKGARSINRALAACLTDLLDEMQIIHITGQLDWPEISSLIEKLPSQLRNRYHAFPYLYKEMGAALGAADLVVSRAGASVLGEFPLFGVPAILIPYPHAWRYQEVNASYLEHRGAALVLQDHELDVHLYATISRLMKDHNVRKEMSRAMSSLATPQAAELIANLIEGLLTVPSPGRI
jgi:UDP-N-acetylglucosamine:LPS N-acetylglucosamine transferase